MDFATIIGMQSGPDAEEPFKLFTILATSKSEAATPASWRDDERCGIGQTENIESGRYDTEYFYLPDGKNIAQCNLAGSLPCCSSHGWCGSEADWCDCVGCIDYRKEQIEARLEKSEEDLALEDLADDCSSRFSKEKKEMEEKISYLSQALAEKEDL
ncbi:hypothetical protein QYM36_002945 [Artemia franciscana]|uniref:Chitin-binding type-1 domain-containing protein n=1 Tax=Artemia franciscana TaxID=6661 RepID=A0AA88I8Z0_ARTSF|nr:hypothetical protein QYM36_002945 [Artemia franciscana]